MNYVRAMLAVILMIVTIIMYADDISPIAPTGNARQNMLDVCHKYGIANDI